MEACGSFGRSSNQRRGIKGGYHQDVAEPDTPTSLIPVCPRIHRIVRSCKIEISACNLGQALQSIPIEPTTISTRILASSQREREGRRGWIEIRWIRKVREGWGGGEKSGGMEKGSGVGIRSGVEFARKAKLVGGNLSRGAVRIHLNPPPPPSSFLRDSSFESLAEKDLVWPSEKRLKGDREGGGGRGG